MAATLTTESKNAVSRRPRFKRRNPPAIRLTDDDLAIIRHVGEHRFLRSTHLIKLMQRSADKVLRRLGALYHNGYLDRPRAQTDHFSQGGSPPLVYALGNRGAALYAGIADIDLASVDWTDKNRDVTRPYIEHALMIADFMIALECAVRQRPEIRLLRAQDIVTHVQKAAGFVHRSWTMSATLPGVKGSVTVASDKVFGVEFTETGRRNYFLVEADRSTIPIERPSLNQSSFAKKLLAYHHG
ncbi:MAG: replication-relaxation family protein, partial [Gammaproteobacteria bacterium]